MPPKINIPFTVIRDPHGQTRRRFFEPIRSRPVKPQEAQQRLTELGKLRYPIAQGMNESDYRGILDDAFANYRALTRPAGDFWQPYDEQEEWRSQQALASSLGATVLAASRLHQPERFAPNFNAVTANLLQKAQDYNFDLPNGVLPISLGAYSDADFPFPGITDYNPYLFRLFASGFHLGNLDLPFYTYTPNPHFRTPLSALLMKGDAFDQKWGTEKHTYSLSSMRDGIIDGVVLFETLSYQLCVTQDTLYLPLAKTLMTLLDLMETYLQNVHAKSFNDGTPIALLDCLNKLLSKFSELNGAENIREEFRRMVAQKNRPDVWIDRLLNWKIAVGALIESEDDREAMLR